MSKGSVVAVADDFPIIAKISGVSHSDDHLVPDPRSSYALDASHLDRQFFQKAKTALRFGQIVLTSLSLTHGLLVKGPDAMDSAP